MLRSGIPDADLCPRPCQSQCWAVVNLTFNPVVSASRALPQVYWAPPQVYWAPQPRMSYLMGRVHGGPRPGWPLPRDGAWAHPQSAPGGGRSRR